MVNPLHLPHNPENINHRTEFDNGTAIGMPPISFSTRKNVPITNVNNTYEYPMISGVKPNKLIGQFGTSFKQDTKTKVSTYYKNQKKALALMKKAGWK